jgi:hypothetical protein
MNKPAVPHVGCVVELLQVDPAFLGSEETLFFSYMCSRKDNNVAPTQLQESCSSKEL